jgi:hypothetical protein
MVGLLLLLGVAGCAARSGMGPPEVTGQPSDEEQAPRLWLTMLQLQSEFEDSQTAATPDCPLARLLVSNICGLGQRICAISARHPEDQSLQTMCQDARRRCDKAQGDLRQRCPEVPGAAPQPPGAAMQTNT